MLVISRNKIALEKIERLKNGVTAFTETSEVANIIKREIEALDMDVYIDETDKGYWFIPAEPKTTA